jgi:hypothetical protein
VEQLPFFNVGFEQGCCKSPALIARALNGRRVLCRVKG